MAERSLKTAFAVLAVLLMALSATMIIQSEDADGAASKGEHDKLTPVWITPEVATLTTTSGEPIVEVTIDFREQSNGDLVYDVQFRNAQMYTSYWIQMEYFNDYGDDSASSSKFHQSTTLSSFARDYWRDMGGTTTISPPGPGGFMADFYVVENGSSSKPYGDSSKLRVNVRYDASTVYDYTTELKYDINGGTGGPSSSTEKSVSSETEMSEVAMTVSDAKDMKRDGYVFKGWSKSLSDTKNLIQPGASISVPAGEATTLYAIWAEDTVTVTLMDGDTVYEKRVVRRGAVPTLPSNLTKADSTFVGWFTDEGLTEKWDSSSKATKDMTLYAGWKPDFYFITDPVADCKVTKVSATTYLFDATVSKDYESSAKITSWTVLKGGEAIYESTGPYMTYQFMEYGKYEVQVKLVNDYGVESVHTETITIEEPSSIDLKSIAIFLIVAVLVVALVVRYLI